MSLQIQSVYQVPEETARIAKSVFPKGNHYMDWYDTFGVLFEDEMFMDVFARDGQPALSPVRLCLVLLMQFSENLSDRQATDAVRSRIDWKYLLCLELSDTGFHYSVLSEFRDRLLTVDLEASLFDKLLLHFHRHGLLKGSKQRSDSSHILARIQTLNRVELVGETMRHTLNVLATVAPDWLQQHSQAEWLERYGQRVNDYRLPKSETERQAYVQTVGEDGLLLMRAICDSESDWLKQIPAVQVLWKVWLQNYCWQTDATLMFGDRSDRPPADITIRTPYDVEARFCKKRTTEWVGFKLHLTETCDEDFPRIVTHVETTTATTHDIHMTERIHQALQEKQCLPEQHLVDSGYVDASLLAESWSIYAVDLFGPSRDDTGWQARENQGFASEDFTIDWQNKQAICPAGQRSLHWLPAINNRGKPIIQIKFSKKTCRICHLQPQCTRSNPPRRSVTIRPEEHHKALLQAREREQTEAFWQQYALRSGIEGTISQATRSHGARQTRYIGLTKTHLQQLFAAMAMNMLRVIRWLNGKRPGQVHSSAFQKLLA